MQDLADGRSCGVISLQSGSNGNSIYVEAGSAKLLFDAGISGIQAEKRLSLHGKDVRSVDAVLISHDHVDHSCSMGIYHRKFGLPIYVTARTYRAVSRYRLGEINDINHFSALGNIAQRINRNIVAVQFHLALTAS